MNHNLRACIAFLTSRLIGASQKTSVYDYSQNKYISISGNIADSRVNIFDHDRGAYISGSIPNLFDYGLNCHISLNISGTHVKGFVYGKGIHYSGNVSGSNVTIFDHGTGQHYQYSV